MVYFAYACLIISMLIAIGNIAGCVGAARRYRRGIEEGYSSVPILSLFFSFLAWAFGGSSIGIWAFIPAALDPGTWMLVGLPLAFFDITWPQKEKRRDDLDSQAPKMASLDYKFAIETVKEALRCWGPIGVIESLLEDGLPPDEYDGYAPQILSEISNGATAETIAKQLAWIRSSSMGLGPGRPSEVEEELGEKLVAWRESDYTDQPDFRFTRYAF